ncbi:MAG: RnfABCDGE type electron transport complex subunit B [Pseudomonadota bacterium]
MAARIDAALPQTQCTRCGYPDCGAYAQAIAFEAAPINQCPPGGAEGVVRLAALTGRPVLPLSAEHGQEAPRTLAVIDENWCIGCTLCIKACPTDAILGANKRMHTVIEPHCTGCEACIPVCPVDCISLDTVSGQATGWAAWSPVLADHARGRYAVHKDRVATGTPDEQDDEDTAAPADAAKLPDGGADAAAQARKAAIAAAMARAREQRAGTQR